MKKISISILVVLALGLAFGQLAGADPNPPEDVDFTITLPAGAVFGHCSFDVELSVTGKGKVIDLPGDRFIFTSPGLRATLTNLVTGKQVTLNITGAFHETTEEDGSVVTVTTGRSLLGDPEAGFVLAIGSFSYVLDASENLIQPLAGEGRLIDVCGLID